MASSKLGSTCSAGANPLLALLLTDSAVFAGWVAAASLAPSLLMHLPAGWCVDRFNRRRLMVLSLWGRLVLCLILAGALILVNEPRWWLIVLTFLDGTLLVLYAAAELTAVRHVVDPEKLPSALAVNESRNHLAQLMGRPLGGFLFTLSNFAPYVVTLVASVWSMIALRLMKEKDYQPRPSDDPASHENDRASGDSLRAALRLVMRSPFLRTVIVVCGVANFFFQTVVLLLVVLAKDTGMSETDIGLLLAASGVGGLAGSALSPLVRRRFRDEQAIIVTCAVAWTGLTFVIAVSAQPVIGLVSWGLLSLMGGHLNVAIMMYLTREVPDRMLGRVLSINRFLTSGAVPLGALAAGYIVVRLQPHAAAWLVFFMILAVTLLTPVLLRPRRCAGLLKPAPRRGAVPPLGPGLPEPAPAPEPVPARTPVAV